MRGRSAWPQAAALRHAMTAMAVVAMIGIAGPGAFAKASDADPYASTYPAVGGSFAIVGATVLTGDGGQIDNGTVVVEHGRVTAVGANAAVPSGVPVVDGRGKWVTPGLIDIHSHMGAMSLPQSFATTGQANETSAPDTAEVRVEHSIRVDDPAFARARESGVTVVQVLPGSVNVIGGRTLVLKNVAATTVEAMKMPGARYGVKMACGENAGFFYGAKGRAPVTSMGAMALARQAFADAQAYAKKRGKGARNLQLETLAGILDGSIDLHVHCYRSDQMAQMIALSHEFGFRIAAFHHATDAYRIAPLLAREGIAVASWGDFFGPQHKIESFNGITENGAFIERAGGIFALHSDSEALVQHLHSSAGRLRALSERMGWPVTRGQAIRWLTLYPARIMGIDREVGSLAVGKAGDVVLWNSDPLSIYSLAEQVFIDGAKVYDRNAPIQPDSDFALGLYRREP